MTEGNSTNTSTKNNICLSSAYPPSPFFFYKAGSTAFEYLYDPFHSYMIYPAFSSVHSGWK